MELKTKNRPRIIGSVPVSSQAALLRQVPPGRAAFRKARDAGNGEPLAKSRNAVWRHLPRNPSGRACFLRDAAFLVAYLERPNCTPRALPRAKTGYGAAAYETGTDPNQSV